MKSTMLIFDLDGTLWDSGRQVADSWNLILTRHIPGFHPLSADDIHSVMGTTMAEIARSFLPDLPEDMREKIFDECQDFEVEYIKMHGGCLFPGVAETLQALKDSGYPMAIVSNCQTGYIPAFLTSMKMSDYFCDYEEWGRTLKSKAENIRLVMERNGFEDAVYIGDIDRDRQAAEAAGIPFIHAAYGFGTCEPAKTVIQQFSDMVRLFP